MARLAKKPRELKSLSKKKPLRESRTLLKLHMTVVGLATIHHLVRPLMSLEILPRPTIKLE